MEGQFIPGTTIPTSAVQWISKADLTTATTVVNAQILTNKQRNQFISFGQDWAVMLMDSERQDMTNPTEDINQISMIDGVAFAIGAAGETTAVTEGERAVPSFSRAQLTAQEFLLQIRLTKRWLMQNIAKAKGNEAVHAECSRAFWWALENAAWFGDTGGSNPAGWGNRLGTTINGWRQQATTNTYDHGGAVPNALLYHNLIITLPTRYRTPNWTKRFKFYMHTNIVERYAYNIQNRLTNLGDGFLMRDDKVFYRGIEFVPAACMPVNIAGTGDASAYGSTTTDVLLCEPRNKVFGMLQNVEVFTHPETDGRIIYNTYSAYIDVAYAMEAAVVRAYNVRNAIA